jgi:phosphoadenosine phosphosulfate reductase
MASFLSISSPTFLPSTTTSCSSPSLPYAQSQDDQLTFEKKVAHATQIISWAMATYGDQLIMSTSFGIQSAVLLHLTLVLMKANTIPTVWIDTGYLPPETYRYALQLKELLSINLKIYQSELSPAHMEAIYGRLWESSDPEERRLYGLLRKVIPMKRAQKELNSKCVLIGLRRQQTDHRRDLEHFQSSSDPDDDCSKVYPLLDWTDDDIRSYFQSYNLPVHPLVHQGYTTVGDAHSSRPRDDHDEHDRVTRFGGTGQQECGLHTESGSLDFLQTISSSTSQKMINSHLASSPLSVVTFPTDPANKECESGHTEYTIYTRSSCRYCVAAKKLLTAKGSSYREIEVLSGAGTSRETDRTISAEKLTSLVQRAREDGSYSVTTVPQIFHHGTHIGGFTDLCAVLSLSEQETEHYLE